MEHAETWCEIDACCPVGDSLPPTRLRFWRGRWPAFLRARDATRHLYCHSRGHVRLPATLNDRYSQCSVTSFAAD